jgi:hypothetical protein
MLRRTDAQQKSSRLSLVGDEVIPAQCENGDGKVRGTPGVGQRPQRTKPKHFLRSVHSQEAISIPAGRTCPHYECNQPGPGDE